jgi:DNA repair exonuclease SbcCD ATPase subunit
MRLRALRLKDVGIFRDPVAIDGFSGRLDVLCGPNEAGKSTLLRAIRAAFLLKHTSRSEAIDRLRPYAGGEPHIEADFEAGGRRWRLVKKFGRGKTAELIDLARAATLHQGVEADDRIAEIAGFGDGLEAPVGLVWIEQGAALKPIEPNARSGGHALLSSAIRAEIEAAAGGSASRAVHGRVEALLDPFVGGRPKGSPKTGSPLDAAQRQRRKVADDLAMARQALATDKDRLDELGKSRARLAELSDPAARSTLEQALAEASRRLEAGRAAAGRLATAAERARAAGLEHAAAANELKHLETALAELARVSQSRAVLEAELARIAPEAEAARRRLEEADAALAAAKDELAQVQAAAVQRAEAAQAAADAAHLADVAQRLASARELDAALVVAERAAKAVKVTASLLEGVEREQRSINLIAERLGAAAAVVLLDLLPAAADRVRIADRVPARNAELRVTEPVEIAIEGIGRIRVTPGGWAERADDEADLAAHRETLAGLLASAGVASLEAARAAGAARQAAEARRAEMAGRLAGLAPHGIGGLEAEHEALASRIGMARPPLSDALPDAVELKTRIAAIEARIGTLAGEHRAARAAHETAAAETERLASKLAAAVTTLAEIEKALPHAAERGQELARLVETCRKTEAALNAAIRERIAIAETAPDTQSLARIEAEHASTRAALQRSDAERHEVERRISLLEGALSSNAEAGGETVVAELDGEHQRLDAEVGRLEAERNALLLLAEVLAEAMSESRERFLAPVLQRLSPYLATVLPDARIAIDEALTPVGLARDQRDEEVARLSDGTQEQIAVIARLGYARLLAETGRPVPLILDDALVNTDDERLSRMFAALAAAASVHQVIVLTCHGRSFEPLVTAHGATALKIVPWDP